MLSQIPTTIGVQTSHFNSNPDPPAPRRPLLPPRARDVSASPVILAPPPPPPASCGLDNIPLHIVHSQRSTNTFNLQAALRTVITYIDICMVMLSMYITSTEASTSHLAQRKKSRRGVENVVNGSTYLALRQYDEDEGELEHPHNKQLIDILAWYAGVLDDRWYVKPISTCWFEEYLFNIYTLDMFYDILRMRRRTFDRLVSDLRPFIQGQQTH